MSWFTKTFSSSIGKKLLMALTGLFLCSFLVIHLIGNLQLFKNDGGFAFNTYAVFMTSNPLIKTISWSLYSLILFHAVWGLLLAFKNQKARPVAYAKTNTSSTWASRNMGVLGTILLVYIVVHMANFWYDYKFGHVPYTKYQTNLVTGETTSEAMIPGYEQATKKVEILDAASQTQTTIIKDLYKEVAIGFKNPLLAFGYVLSMIAVAYHLIHGFQSAFQTLGFNNKKYTPIIKGLGIWLFGIIIPIAFAAMPLYFFFK